MALIPRFIIILLTGGFLLSCGTGPEGHKLEPPKVRFDHGVASGDPLVDRVILWTRVTPELPPTTADGSTASPTPPPQIPVDWQVALDETFASTVAQGTVIADAENDYAARIDTTGLEQATTYFYRFTVGERKSPVGRTRTLPAGEVERVRLVALSCSNYPSGFFHVYRAVADRNDLDVVLHLGDYLYEYGRGGYGSEDAVELGREVNPPHEIITLDDYRRRYQQYRSDPDLQALHRRHPMIAVWDDHELANNAWVAGAENHDTETEGPWQQRRNAAVRAYREWLPLRDQGETPDTLGKIYRSFQFGNLATLLMLDSRVAGRDQQLDYSGRLRDFRTSKDAQAFLSQELGAPARQLLGEEQEAWLTQQLADSRERNIPWQVLGQQLLIAPIWTPDLEGVDPLPTIVPGSASHKVLLRRIAFFKRLRQLRLPWNLDAWDGYPAARERLYEMFEEHANQAVVISGDTHNSWAFHLEDTKENKIYGIELGTPSVSSPGMEDYLPMDPQQLIQRLRQAMPHLQYGNSTDRGYLLLDITPKKMHVEWHYVDTIKNRQFNERCEKALQMIHPSAGGDGRLQEAECKTATVP